MLLPVPIHGAPLKLSPTDPQPSSAAVSAARVAIRYGLRQSTACKSVRQLLSNDRYRTNFRPCYFLHGRRAERQCRYAGHETARCTINGDWDIYHGATKLNGTLPISRGGTSGTTAATALYNLINALSAVTPVAGDRIPFMDADGKTAGFVTLTNLLTALGFSNGILPLAKGGTGSSTAAGARSNLGITPANIGAAKTSHSHSGNDITSGQIDLARLPFKCAWGTAYVTGVSWATVAYSSGSGASSFQQRQS